MTPELDKMSAVQEDSHTIGEFLAWPESRKMAVCELQPNGWAWVNDEDVMEWTPVGKSINDLLADYFEIDLRKVDEEKRALLETLRSHSE